MLGHKATVSSQAGLIAGPGRGDCGRRQVRGFLTILTQKTRCSSPDSVNQLKTVGAGEQCVAKLKEHSPRELQR